MKYRVRKYIYNNKSMVKEQLGKEIYLPFIYSLFFFYFNSKFNR